MIARIVDMNEEPEFEKFEDVPEEIKKAIEEVEAGEVVGPYDSFMDYLADMRMKKYGKLY